MGAVDEGARAAFEPHVLQDPLDVALDDTTGCLHDTLIALRNPDMYRRFGWPENHPSCLGNFHATISEAGIAIPFVPSLHVEIGLSPRILAKLHQTFLSEEFS